MADAPSETTQGEEGGVVESNSATVEHHQTTAEEGESGREREEVTGEEERREEGETEEAKEDGKESPVVTDQQENGTKNEDSKATEKPEEVEENSAKDNEGGGGGGGGGDEGGGVETREGGMQGSEGEYEATEPTQAEGGVGEGGGGVGEEGEGGGEEEEGRPPTVKSETSTVSDSTKLQKEERRREKERKKAEKKAKKKSKTSKDATPSSPPKLKKRAGQGEGPSWGSGSKQLEAVLLAVFHPFDGDGSGYVDPTVFWDVLQSVELNLQLTPDEVSALQEMVTADRSGLIPYAKFAAHASDIIASIYQNEPQNDTHWTDMRTPNGGRIISYNKQTGESRDLVEDGVDLFSDIIEDLYHMSDQEGKGFVSRENFWALLQSEQMRPYLLDNDVTEMLQYFDDIPEGQADYANFYPLAKELILRVYRVKDTSDSEWCQLSSPKFGYFLFNKYTGETRRGDSTTGTESGQPNIDLLTQAYHQVDEMNFELEKYKQENRELQNEVARGREELEVLATQLDETGHTLDEANVDIHSREEEVGILKVELLGREQEIEGLRMQVGEMERLRGYLKEMEQQLQETQGIVAAKDQSMEAQGTNIYSLQRQSQSVIEKLKAAQGTIDARDSTISKLEHQIRVEQKKMKGYEEMTPSLEEKVMDQEEALKKAQQQLEEKMAALSTTRKHLKHARERNMELEKDMEKAGHTHEKLRSAESEIRTLKTFLTSKTAMVERRKKELLETKAKLAELEEKDTRRAIILADVLEKTARHYQQELHGGRLEGTHGAASPPRVPDSMLGVTSTDGGRPVSAPSIPADLSTFPTSSSPPHTLTTRTKAHPHKLIKSYTMGGAVMSHSRGGGGGGRRGRGATQPQTSTPLKLPSIHINQPPQKSFRVPTSKELKRCQKNEDKKIVAHSDLNPHCTCQLCTATPHTMQSLSSGNASQMALIETAGEPEKRLAKELRIGQRVLVRMRTSTYDLEPQKCTGIVKYVGKIDSEFIDNRIYVGVKLDEPVGDTDGVVKGKRYFTCPAKHGKVVRLTNVMAILPNKSMAYKPLHISKRSPYTTSQKRVKVT